MMSLPPHDGVLTPGEEALVTHAAMRERPSVHLPARTTHGLESPDLFTGELRQVTWFTGVNPGTLS